MGLFSRKNDEQQGTIHAYRSGQRNAFDWTWDSSTGEVRIGVLVRLANKQKLDQVVCGRAGSSKEAQNVAQGWVDGHPDAKAPDRLSRQRGRNELLRFRPIRGLASTLLVLVESLSS